LEYQGRDITEIRKHISEAGASIIFAIVAATVIRAFTFEAFTIPTPSMERSMMVGDFVFVSKAHYGVRLPITPFALPLVHNKVPLINVTAFSDVVGFPYLRLPKFQAVKRNHPVVFNYPMQDEFPIDKRDHYVKRCLAVPGDRLQIVDGEVFVNEQINQLPDRADRQFQYYVETKNIALSPKVLKERFDINYLNPQEMQSMNATGDVLIVRNEPPNYAYLITISDSAIGEFSKLPNITALERLNSKQKLSEYANDLPRDLLRIYHQYPDFQPNNGIFPNLANSKDLAFNWTRDNYGPIDMPKEGETVQLTPNNYLLYRRIIEVYEGNKFDYREGKFFINDVETNSYTFKQGYYWMMGDNRHNSLDSRYWGFVPEDHIVGKPVFIWMSYDKFADKIADKIRFDRVFTTVNGSGERISYFWPVAILGSLIYFFIKRRQKKAAA
jgi:signal peptidase I